MERSMAENCRLKRLLITDPAAGIVGKSRRFGMAERPKTAWRLDVIPHPAAMEHAEQGTMGAQWEL
jgi:hypothetical protein